MRDDVQSLQRVREYQAPLRTDTLTVWTLANSQYDNKQVPRDNKQGRQGQQQQQQPQPQPQQQLQQLEHQQQAKRQQQQR